jgi:hypothetical protein
MNSKTLLIVLLKVVAVYLFATDISGIITYAIYVLQNIELQQVVAFLIATAVKLANVYILVVKAKPIADMLIVDHDIKSASKLQGFTTKQLLQVALAIFSLWLIANGVISFTQFLYNKYSLKILEGSNWMASIVSIIIGLLCIGEKEKICNWLNIQYEEPDEVAPDNTIDLLQELED